jgi:hypothetical protein
MLGKAVFVGEKAAEADAGHALLMLLLLLHLLLLAAAAIVAAAASSSAAAAEMGEEDSLESLEGWKDGRGGRDRGVGQLEGCTWRSKVGGSQLRMVATASRSNVERCFATARESCFGKKGGKRRKSKREKRRRRRKIECINNMLTLNSRA